MKYSNEVVIDQPMEKVISHFIDPENMKYRQGMPRNAANKQHHFSWTINEFTILYICKC